MSLAGSREVTSDDTYGCDDEGLLILQDLELAVWKSKVLCASLKLGIFELLEKSAVPLSVDTVAQQLGLNSIYGTEAVLNACVALRLLKRAMDKEQEVAVYSNTELSRKWLLKDGSPTMFPYTSMLGEFHGCSLEEALQTGVCQLENKELDLVKLSEAKGDTWVLNMCKAFYSKSGTVARFATTTFDLSSFKIICDIGGNHGAILHDCARVYPKAQLILFDIPKVIDMAPKFIPTDLEPAKIQLVKGDFFKDTLPEADLYILKNILNLWSQKDERVLELLNKIYDTLPKGGALLILERLLDEDKCGPMHTVLFSVMMSCAQEGREMSGNEYKQLMEKIGFKDVQFKTGSISIYIGAVIGFK